jgi:hypothetical protein
MKICYIARAFSPDSERTITTANEILEDYAQQGYDLTLRQLYYQFVSRGLIANKDTEYKKLGSVVNDARLAGRIDWNHITDRTRNLRANAHWDSPRDIVDACAQQFRFDKWAAQPNYVEVWVEKDALVGVLEVACKPLDVPYFSCRGYTSQSEMWVAAMRIVKQLEAGKSVYVVHLGDHDPSGIDMSRDITDRITMFVEHHLGGSAFELNRIALNMNQVRQYNPPPNPAKITDSRATAYIAKHGDESWELDALEPRVLTALIQDTVENLRDPDEWDAAVKREDKAKAALRAAAVKL